MFSRRHGPARRIGTPLEQPLVQHAVVGDHVPDQPLAHEVEDPRHRRTLCNNPGPPNCTVTVFELRTDLAFPALRLRGAAAARHAVVPFALHLALAYGTPVHCLSACSTTLTKRRRLSVTSGETVKNGCGLAFFER